MISGRPLNPSLTPSDGERVAKGRVRVASIPSGDHFCEPLKPDFRTASGGGVEWQGLVRNKGFRSATQISVTRLDHRRNSWGGTLLA